MGSRASHHHVECLVGIGQEEKVKKYRIVVTKQSGGGYSYRVESKNRGFASAFDEWEGETYVSSEQEALATINKLMRKEETMNYRKIIRLPKRVWWPF